MKIKKKKVTEVTNSCRLTVTLYRVNHIDYQNQTPYQKEQYPFYP